MGSVKIQGTFAAKVREYDGVGANAEQIAAEPNKRIMVVGELEVTEVTKQVSHGGVLVPKVRVASWEIATGDDELAVRQIRDNIYQERTGQAAPPPTLWDDSEEEQVPADKPKKAK